MDLLNLEFHFGILSYSRLLECVYYARPSKRRFFLVPFFSEFARRFANKWLRFGLQQKRKTNIVKSTPFHIELSYRHHIELPQFGYVTYAINLSRKKKYCNYRLDFVWYLCISFAHKNHDGENGDGKKASKHEKLVSNQLNRT